MSTMAVRSGPLHFMTTRRHAGAATLRRGRWGELQLFMLLLLTDLTDSTGQHLIQVHKLNKYIAPCFHPPASLFGYKTAALGS